MKYPPLENKLRDYRFEQLQTKYMLRYGYQGIIALTSVMALLVALFRQQMPPAVLLVFAAAGLCVAAIAADYFGRKRALEALRRELPPGESYEPPRELF